MVDQDDQGADLLGDAADDLAESLRLLLGKTGGGLVEQHETGRADDGPGHLDEAALSGAERADVSLRDIAEAHELDRFVHVLTAARPLAFGVLEDQEHVLVHRKVRDRLLGLERAPHAPARPPEVGHREQVVAERAHDACDRPHEPAEHVEERRLAGTVRPDETARARRERDGHPVERHDAAEPHRQPVDLDHAVGSAASTPGTAAGACDAVGAFDLPLPVTPPMSFFPRLPKSCGTCSTMPPGAVRSTCRMPMPNRIVKQLDADAPLSGRAPVPAGTRAHRRPRPRGCRRRRRG